MSDNKVTKEDWIKICVAAGLFILSLILSYIVVSITAPVIPFVAFITLTYFLGKTAIRASIATGLILRGGYTILIILLIIVILSAVIVWIFADLIKIIITIVLAWLLFKWMLKEIYPEIVKELDEYIYTGGEESTS